MTFDFHALLFTQFCMCSHYDSLNFIPKSRAIRILWLLNIHFCGGNDDDQRSQQNTTNYRYHLTKSSRPFEKSVVFNTYVTVYKKQSKENSQLSRISSIETDY